jgi:hypothetical protein
MATESSDPRVGLIVQIGLLSIGALIATHMGMTAYFDHMARAEIYRKVGSEKPDALMSLRADEKQRLSSGSMPIDRSMQMLVARGRMGASPDLAPSASKDVAPLQGWTRMPSEVPPTMMEAASTPAPSASAITMPSSAPSGAASAPPAGSNAPRHP